MPGAPHDPASFPVCKTIQATLPRSKQGHRAEARAAPPRANRCR